MEATVNPPPAGPMVLGAVVIGAGAYTDIISITAPSSAKYGDPVTVQVKVKNLYTTGIYIAVTGRFDTTTITFSPDYASVGAGATYTFSSSFTMPNKSVKVEVWSYYWTGTEWYQDDYEYVNIALSVVYSGKISRKELEYDGTYATIPVSNIPQGKRGLVHIWGRNDMTSTQRMGIWWRVTDLGGSIVEEYSSDWESTGAGSTHEFIGGRFTLSKVGTYTIDAALYMNPSDPQLVDRYTGTLCTVAAVLPEPEFSGFGIKDYSKI